MKLCSLFFIVACLAQSAYAGNGAKGGEDLSPEFLNIVHNLPNVIKFNEFPELNKADFLRAISDPYYRVETVRGLKVNGAFKAALSDPQLDLTQIDPDFWRAYSVMVDGAVRKNVVAFHEKLVIMGKEDNDDFHLSSRLYSNTTQFFNKNIVSVGRVTPIDIKDRSIINVVNYDDGTSTFNYCDDRNDTSTCAAIGRLSHAYSQINFVALNTALLKKLKVETWTRNLTPVAVGAGIGVITKGEGVGYAVGAGIFGGGLIGGIALTFEAMHVDTLKDYAALTDPRVLQGEALVYDRHDDDDMKTFFENLLQWID